MFLTKKLLVVLFLCISVSAFAARPASDPGQSPSDFPHPSKHQVRHVVLLDCPDCIFEPDPDPGATGGGGCKTDRVCQLTKAQCVFDVYSFCTTDAGTPSQPCKAC